MRPHRDNGFLRKLPFEITVRITAEEIAAEPDLIDPVYVLGLVKAIAEFDRRWGTKDFLAYWPSTDIDRRTVDNDVHVSFKGLRELR